MSQSKKETQQKPKKPQKDQKPRLSKQQVDKYFPPRKFTPMRQLPPGPNGQVRLNHFQKSLTVGQLQLWQTKVPSSDEEDQSSEKDHPKPFEEHQIDETQKRITDYISQRPKKSSNQVEQNAQKSFSKQSLQKPKAQFTSPERLKKQHENEYKVVVKESPPEKQLTQAQSFYKNNDIYGVEKEISQLNHQKNHQKVQKIDFSVPPKYKQDKTDKQSHKLLPVSKKKSEEKQVLRHGQSRISKQAAANRVQDSQNSNRSNLPASFKKQALNTDFDQRQKQNQHNLNDDVQIDGKNQPSNSQDKVVEFFYNKQGDLILTQQAYKEPLSAQNIKAYIFPAQTRQKFEVQEDYLRLEDKNLPDQSRVPQPLRSSSAKKLIIYQKQQELQRILDYLGMEEQKIPEGAFVKDKSEKLGQEQQKFQKISKQEQTHKDVQINGKSKQKQSELKPIKRANISDLNSHLVSEEQILMDNSHSFADMPTTVINFNQIPTYVPSQRSQKSAFSVQKITTKKKQLFKANTGSKFNPKANTGSKFNTPSKNYDDQQSRSRKEYIPEGGSVYHFEVIPDKASKKKNLVQVRRSSRIYKKSKPKLQKQDNQQLKKIEQVQNDDFTNTITMNAKQYKTQAQRSSSKSKKKPSVISKTSAKSKPKPKKQNDDEQITIEWLKEHIGDQISIHYAYMEQDYYAMTENDQAISRFLQQLENQKEKVQVQKPQAQQTIVKNEQSIRENRLIKPSLKIQQKKAKSTKKIKQSKGQTKKQVNQKQSKSKGNIKIERTVEIAVKTKPSKVILEDQIDQGAPWPGPFLQQEEDITKLPEAFMNPNDQPQRHSNPSQSVNRPLQKDENKRIFKDNKQKYKIPEMLPITVQEVINPDILGLGVYALVRLGRLSEFQFGTRYAITPLCIIKFAKKKDVLQALKESKKLVPPEYADNIALIALNTMLIQLIEKAKNKKDEKDDDKDNQSKNDKEIQI